MLFEIIRYTTLVLAVCSIVMLLWIGVCGQRAAKQRQALHRLVHNFPTDKERNITAYHQVSMDIHIRELLFFRDPLKLYDFSFLENN